MFVRAHSAALWGIEALPVVVEAHRGQGLPGLTLVGLARGAVRESLVRVRAALHGVGVSLGTAKLVVNMLPAELPKDGSALDLPLAAALLCMAGALPAAALDGVRLCGELSLGGEVQGVRGAVQLADLARAHGDRALLLPLDQAQQAAILPGVCAIGIASLRALLGHLRGEQVLAPAQPAARDAAEAAERAAAAPCLSEVRGQRRAKRALEVAAAGGHNLLLVGAPGSGKTMLARRLVHLLPPLSRSEQIEVTRIQAAAAHAGDAPLALAQAPPFRAPHHTASDVALVGGGSVVRPGEVTLAHRGILFLDELPEFSRRALEALREPLEEGIIHISRASMALSLPCRVLLVAAMNPCPCGQLRPAHAPARGGRPCLCAMAQVQRYRARISGPLLERIDLHVDVAPVPFAALRADAPSPRQSETTAVVRERVLAARARQAHRLGPGRTNASMTAAELAAAVPLRGAVARTLEVAVQAHGLSARAVARVLRVARTLADLRLAPEVGRRDVALALRLRGAGPMPAARGGAAGDRTILGPAGAPRVVPRGAP